MLASLLVGCSTAPSVRVESAQAERAQIEREVRLQRLMHWGLSGRVAVSVDGDGGSGSVQWTEAPDHSEFELRAPVTGRSWRLIVTGRSAVIEGLDGGPRRDSDPQRLLRESIGWEIPLSSLRFWVRGLRAPGPAGIEYGADGYPSLIRQQGWRVEFRDWMETTAGKMPKRVFAVRDDHRVRLAASRWQFEHG